MRAIREKMKWYLIGRKGQPGLLPELAEVQSCCREMELKEQPIAVLPADQSQLSPDTEVVYQVRVEDEGRAAVSFAKLGAKPVGKGRYEFKARRRDAPGSLDRFRQAYMDAMRSHLEYKHVERAVQQVMKRIQSIDHIPLRDIERAHWTEAGADFVRWIFHQLFNDTTARWTKDYIFEAFGARWTEFYLDKYRASRT